MTPLPTLFNGSSCYTPLLIAFKVCAAQTKVQGRICKTLVVSDDVRVPLNSVPDERPPRPIIGRKQVGKAGEVSVQVLPLHIGRAEGHEDRRCVG